MRPTAIELLRGIRALLVEDVLPATTTPHLRTQVTLAIGMLDTVSAELNDAPAAYAEERARAITLAADAAAVLRRLAPDSALLDEIQALARAPSEPPDLRLTALQEESARLLALLDRLATFCDDYQVDSSGDTAIPGLRQRIDAELHTLVARRARWLGGLAVAGG